MGREEELEEALERLDPERSCSPPATPTIRSSTSSTCSPIWPAGKLAIADVGDITTEQLAEPNVQASTPPRPRAS